MPMLNNPGEHSFLGADSGHLTDTLEILSHVSNYNRWVYDQLRPFIDSNILEVGCGIGNVTQFLLRHGQVTGIDIDPVFCDATRRRISEKKLHVYVMDVTNVDYASFDRAPFDTILLINILEHVEDEKAALDSIHRLLAPAGRVLFFLPAMKWLFGSLDRKFGHFRRYQKTGFSRLMHKSGFRIISAKYVNITGALGWFFFGRVLKVTDLPTGEVSIFDRIFPVTSTLEKRLDLPFGQSLVVVAEKCLPEENRPA